MKDVFDGVRRKAVQDQLPVRYFEHLKEVMKIVLHELPNPSVEKLIIALLHDVVEDIDRYTIDFVRAKYGDRIADGVEALSKKNRRLYLSEPEQASIHGLPTDNPHYQNTVSTAKERRNQDYFGHLGQLPDYILDIKFADRIHNLRDLAHLDIATIERKVAETERYFMHIAAERNPIAHQLLEAELHKLHQLIASRA